MARILRVAALLALTWFGFYQIGFELRLGNYGIRLGDFDITSNRTDIEFVNSRHFPRTTFESGGHVGVIKGLVFTPDGKQIISASEDKTIRAWDLESGRTSRVIRSHAEPGFTGQIYAIAMSPDGQWLAAAGWFSSSDPKVAWAIRLYDLPTGRVVAMLDGHTNVVNALAFSPDGRTLVSASTDETAIVWDVPSRQLKHSFKGHAAPVLSVAFMPNGERIVTSGRW